MSDIFDEVNEDLRAEQTRHLLRRYGGLVIVLLVLVLVGVGGWEGWKYEQSQQTARFAASYLAAQHIADGPPGAQRQAAIPAFEPLIKTGNPAYRSLARLRIAAIKADAGDADAALALWDQVASDTEADPALRDVANLEWAMHQMAAGDPAAIAARLVPLAEADKPWHDLAQEQQALLAMRQGHDDDARSITKRLADDTTAPEGVRQRANALLTRLGGQAGG